MGDVTMRVGEFNPEKGLAYDMFVAAVGYEARARYVVTRLRPRARRALGLGFVRDQVLEFETNRTSLQKYGFHVQCVEDSDVTTTIAQELRSAVSEDADRVRVGIDFSSLTRVRIALIFDALRRAVKELRRPVSIDWYYAIARFSKPPTGFVPNQVAEPVSPVFAGWVTEPERDTVAIVGMGYEEDKALGAVELVQPSQTWALRPVSLDPRYDVAVTAANARLLEVARPRSVLTYRVEHPIECFAVLESLTYGSLKTGNPVILPFGPKPLGLCAVLVAHMHPQIAVWRVSAGGAEKPVNRKASGRLCGLTVDLTPATRTDIEAGFTPSEPIEPTDSR